MKTEAYYPAGAVVPFPEKMDLKSLLVYGVEVYKLRRQVAIERKELADLPDDLLIDIGVSRGDAVLESRRDPGDLPQSRLNEIEKQLSSE